MRTLSLFLLLMLAALSGAAAQQLVTGTVTSAEDGLPVIGATVLIKGTDRGTATDLDGSYSLEVPGPEAVLVFSYTGSMPQEIQVGGQSRIDVVLQPQISVLEEVVVVGYGNQKRSDISGSVSVITAEEITETPALRVEQALQGRAAGVLVTQNSGSPGSPLNINIRGISTLGDSGPLFIVDGIPVDGLDFLNPSDIESISVLKDAASAGIYGTRAANGVVLITTKSGKKDQAGRISYEGYAGQQVLARKLNLLNAREFAIISNEMHITGGKAPRPEFRDPDLLGEGTDWQEAIFEPAPMTSHQLSFTGGNEKSTYALTGNYFRQDGIVGGEKSGFERYTVRLNTTHQMKPWLRLGNTLNFTVLERNFLPENNEFTSPIIRALNMDPVTPVRKADGTYAYSLYADTDITNPVNAIQNTYDTWKTHRVVGSVFAELTLPKGFRFKSTYSVDATFATRDIFIPKFDLSNDPVLSDAPAGEKNETNSVAINHNTWKNWQVENTLHWNHTFQDVHALEVTLGNTALERRAEWSGGSNTNLPSNDPRDAYISNTIDPITSQGAFEGASENALLSFFGRLNYALDERYLFSATLRIDGSSRFGANNRYGRFPSFSAAWVLSREDFFALDAVSFLKLRASWGRNGIDRNIGDYDFTATVFTGQNYTFGPGEVITNGSVPLTPPNPDLKWETIEQTDFGLDAEFFEGRFTLTADYFIKKSLDFLFRAPIPLVAGAAFPPGQNVGSIRNQGFELALQYRNRVGAFKYSLGANFTAWKNEVLSLGFGEPQVAGRIQSANAFVSRTEVGHPVASFYGYIHDGIFQTQAEVEAHAFQSENTAPGDIRFRDLNGDGVIDADDQTYIGNPTPDFVYGLQADFEFKGFDLGLFIQGVQGNEIYNATVRYDFIFVNRPQNVLERWTGPGTSNFEPRVSIADPNQNARVSTRFVEDGSYLRLKNIQLGYSLPPTLLRRYKLEKLRLYVSAQNLLTLTDYSGYDPEIGAVGTALELGIDRGFYPQARTFLAGLQLAF